MTRLVLASFALMTLLAGCGTRGDLERPPPMWGRDRAQQQEDEEARQRAAQGTQPSAAETPGVGSGSSSIPVPSN